MYLWCTLHSGLKTQWMLANLMIIVVSLYHFGYSLLMICLVSWSNVTSFLNESLVAPKRLFEKKIRETTKKKIFGTANVKSCVSHIFRIEYSGSSPQLKPHTSQRSSEREIVCVSKTIFMPLCTSEKSVSDVSFFFFLQNRLLHFSVWEEHRQSIASNFVVGPTVCLIYVLGIWPYGMAVWYIPVFRLNLCWQTFSH